jgi:hypothetical protein
MKNLKNPYLWLIIILVVFDLAYIFWYRFESPVKKPEVDTTTFITNHSEITDSTLNDK